MLRTSTVTVCLNSHVTVRLVLSICCTFECKHLPCLIRESSPPHGNRNLGAGGGPAWACFLICEMGIWTAPVFPRPPIRGCCEHAEGVVGGCSAHSLLTGQGWERATFWLCSLGSHAGPRAQKGQNVVYALLPPPLNLTIFEQEALPVTWHRAPQITSWP